MASKKTGHQHARRAERRFLQVCEMLSLESAELYWKAGRERNVKASLILEAITNHALATQSGQPINPPPWARALVNRTIKRARGKPVAVQSRRDRSTPGALGHYG